MRNEPSIDLTALRVMIDDSRANMTSFRRIDYELATPIAEMTTGSNVSSIVLRVHWLLTQNTLGRRTEITFGLVSNGAMEKTLTVIWLQPLILSTTTPQPIIFFRLGSEIVKENLNTWTRFPAFSQCDSIKFPIPATMWCVTRSDFFLAELAPSIMTSR